MRLPVKEMNQCHSHTVGHGPWDDMIDETAWQRNEPVSLTYCWSWDAT